MSKEKVSNLFPLQITDVYANRISSQIFEGLLKIDPSNTQVIPSLAESMEVSDESRLFTFKLVKGVLFHDNACFQMEKEERLKRQTSNMLWNLLVQITSSIVYPGC